MKDLLQTIILIRQKFKFRLSSYGFLAYTQTETTTRDFSKSQVINLIPDGERDNSFEFKFEKNHTSEKNFEFGVIVYYPIHTFLMRNSFMRNLYWEGQIAKKLSVIKVQRLRNFFFHFQYHNFEGRVTNEMFRKDSFCGTSSHS